MIENKEKKICVCIPTYNREELIEKAIVSLIEQEDGSLDVHVFDDASTDNTRNVVEKYKKHRVYYHRNFKNLGYVENVNNCLKMSSDYDWVGILHNDDIHTNNSIKIAKKYIVSHPDVGLIFSSVHVVDENGSYKKRVISRERLFMAGRETGFFFNTPLPCSSIFYNSKAISSVGLLSSQFPYSADEEYTTRISKNFDIVQADEVIACYRVHRGHYKIETWTKPDFIETFRKMRFAMAEHAFSDKKEIDYWARKSIAHTLFYKAPILLVEGHRDHYLKFLRESFLNDKMLFFKPKNIAHLFIQAIPFFNKYFYRKRMF